MGIARIGKLRLQVGWPLLVILLAIVGLLLPAYGPALESGYAEMLPGHSHVFLAQTPGHSHSYATNAAGADTTGEGGGVLALPGIDNSGSIAIVVAAAFAALASGVALIAPVTTVRSWVFRQLALVTNALVPTTPPPKPSL